MYEFLFVFEVLAVKTEESSKILESFLQIPVHLILGGQSDLSFVPAIFEGPTDDRGRRFIFSQILDNINDLSTAIVS